MISIRLFAAPFAALLACGVAFAGTQPEFDYSGTESSVYQWSVTSSPPDVERRDGRAFLWIPERCRRLVGVVVGQQNMLEEPVFECPAFAGVSLKGAWADRSKDWGSEAVGRGLAGIPFLLLDGEYEDAENRARRSRTP